MKRYGMTVLVAALLLAAHASARGGGRGGGWGVGSGGDGMRVAFARAREHAAHVVLKLEPAAIPPRVDADVRQWLIDHRAALSADIAASEHDWTLDEKATCAWTQLERGAAVNLSYPTCRARLDSFDEAAQLLVHEAVHHFGIGDEDFADKVALAVYDAWRSGTIDWVATSLAPEPRLQHVAVWTGREVLIQGGIVQRAQRSLAPEVTSSLYAFDPERNTWRQLSSGGAPQRFGHAAVWADGRLVVWGGYVVRGQSKIWQNSGAVYDPESDSWSELRTPYGPAELADLTRTVERPVQQLVHTGKELFVFGGMPVDGRPTGGIYDLASGQWRAIDAAGAPYRTYGHSAVWTGDRIVVFGGVDLEGNLTNAGAAYDLATNSWSAISQAGAPPAREGHSAVFTGTRMIVFGGYESGLDAAGIGGVYDPAKDSWKSFETEAVLSRTGHSAVWTGSEMLVFGGRSKRQRTFRAVSAYNPGNNAWRVVEAASNPDARYLHSGVWTGRALVVFGGSSHAGAPLGSGGLFYP
jgi:N-acetylneuraminic acid mutarotase